jgi:dephospho-CoA kinase
MSGWPGKYAIGLTGNIATGKSVVRKMLEHLGAYGIDADALGHRAIARDAPGYQPVLDTFGRWILGPDGQIDRSKLARLVFANPDALVRLEAIVHPLVGQAVDILIRRSSQKVIVIEAIKLIESGLIARCDSLWVSSASQEIQLARLMQKRGMDEATARQRIQSQPDAGQKVALANVVIRNEASFEETWMHVLKAWQSIFPTPEPVAIQPAKAAHKGEKAVQRARPRQAAEIADLINRLSAGQRKLSRADVMASFGEKAFLLLTVDGIPAGVVGWKVENLVARIDDVYIEDSLPFAEAMHILMHEVERASRELQCEAALLFLPASLPNSEGLASQLGYQSRSVQGLGVRAWQEAAVESMPANSMMSFKQLRQDRVLRPV